jgi:hypothetical protein
MRLRKKSLSLVGLPEWLSTLSLGLLCSRGIFRTARLKRWRLSHTRPLSDTRSSPHASMAAIFM